MLRRPCWIALPQQFVLPTTMPKVPKEVGAKRNTSVEDALLLLHVHYMVLTG